MNTHSTPETLPEMTEILLKHEADAINSFMNAARNLEDKGATAGHNWYGPYISQSLHHPETKQIHYLHLCLQCRNESSLIKPEFEFEISTFDATKGVISQTTKLGHYNGQQSLESALNHFTEQLQKIRNGEI